MVLAWLSSHPSKWKFFIANRTSEILTILDSNQWPHVKTKDNPADCASRGVKECDNLSLWRHGPSWLSELEICYSSREECQDTKLEERTNMCHTIDSVEADDILLTRFSTTLCKLIRTVAYSKGSRKSVFPAYITNMELAVTLDTCIIFKRNILLVTLKLLKEVD